MKKSIKIALSVPLAWISFIIIFKLQGITTIISLEWALFMAIQLPFFLTVSWSKNIKIVNMGLIVMIIVFAIICYLSAIAFSIFLLSEFSVLLVMLIFTLFYRIKLKGKIGVGSWNISFLNIANQDEWTVISNE